MKRPSYLSLEAAGRSLFVLRVRADCVPVGALYLRKKGIICAVPKALLIHREIYLLGNSCRSGFNHAELRPVRAKYFRHYVHYRGPKVE